MSEFSRSEVEDAYHHFVAVGDSGDWSAWADLHSEDGVWLEPTPGHTPGHVSVHITSAGQEALITGDCIHHPVQMTRTDWCSSADYDQSQGLATRESLLDRYVDKDTLIIGTHFAIPMAGHIKRLDTGGYWLDVS